MGLKSLCIAVTARRDRVYAAGPLGVSMWDTATGRIAKQFPLRGAERPVLSPDESILAVSDRGTIVLFSTCDGSTIRRLEGHTAPTGTASLMSAIRALAFSPDGRMLASAGFDHSLRVWNVDDGKAMMVVPHFGEAGGLAFAPDSTWLAVTFPDKASQRFVLATRSATDLPHEASHGTSVVFSPDGATVAILAGDSDHEITLLNVSDLSLRSRMPVTETAYGIGFSPDGKTVAICRPVHRRLLLWGLDDNTTKPFGDQPEMPYALAFLSLPPPPPCCPRHRIGSACGTSRPAPSSESSRNTPGRNEAGSRPGRVPAGCQLRV